MTTDPLCWAVSVPIARFTPEMRLATALDMAAGKPGIDPTTVYVHPAVIAETRAPERITLLPCASHRNVYRFRYLDAEAQ